MPQKRSRRLKDHKVLQEIANGDPDTDDIFEDNLIDNFYPQRPLTLKYVCLYDFVANYDWQGKYDSGDRMYTKLTKLRKPRGAHSNMTISDLENGQNGNAQIGREQEWKPPVSRACACARMQYSIVVVQATGDQARLKWL